MSIHYLALTIDADPDGLSGKNFNRASLVWDGLHFGMENFPDALSAYPLTWYVRADGQLEHTYGSVRHSLDTYADFWQSVIDAGGELGWHPHLHTVPQDDSQPEIIFDSVQAVAELKRIWEQLDNLPFELASFRMGESWHTADTFNLIEEFGFTVDSTAIPDRDDSANGHPRNWRETPNRPYYPDKKTPRLEGTERQLLEIPLTSWRFQAPYDTAPKLRYMNPCIHSDLWQQALQNWKDTIISDENFIWVMIFHPGEAMPQDNPDMLYAWSLDVVKQNLMMMEQTLHDLGHSTEWVTMSKIAEIYRNI